jgi:hypothetical protein
MRLSIEVLKKVENEFGEFDISQVMGGTNDVYLRFGYWNQINVGKLSEILGESIIVEEDSDYDDDCGYKYMYRLFDTIFHNKNIINELY